MRDSLKMDKPKIKTLNITNRPLKWFWFCILSLSLSHATLDISSGWSQSTLFDYDALIDDPPITQKRGRFIQQVGTPSGFQIGPFIGMYFGAAASYLTSELSSLDAGAFPQYGLHIGYQISPRWTIGLDSSFGTGRTFEEGAYDTAFDLLFRPSLSISPLIGKSWKWTIDLGGQIVVYDLERQEVSQVGVGPYTGTQLIYNLDKSSQIYLGFGWSYLYDLFAFSFRPPTEEELMDNPNLVRFKVKGAWFNLNQVMLGYRLFGF